MTMGDSSFLGLKLYGGSRRWWQLLVHGTTSDSRIEWSPSVWRRSKNKPWQPRHRRKELRPRGRIFPGASLSLKWLKRTSLEQSEESAPSRRTTGSSKIGLHQSMQPSGRNRMHWTGD